MLHTTKVRVKSGQTKPGETNGQDRVLLLVTYEQKFNMSKKCAVLSQRRGYASYS